MLTDRPVAASDLKGLSRLAVEATTELVDLVEAVHDSIERPIGVLAPPIHLPVKGIRMLAYSSVRGVTQLIGATIDIVLSQLAPLLDQDSSWPGRDALQSALNGVLGDYLVSSGNPLAIGMSLRYESQRLQLDKAAMAAAIPQVTGRIVVLAHGLCMNDQQWSREGQSYGTRLAHDLGYTPVFLRYNSGQHVSTNGREFADLLEALVKQWPLPVEELAIIGHSMGGLLARSACHYAQAQGFAWPQVLKRMVFIGTPHHGAPLERGGNWVQIVMGVTPFTAPFARLGKIRSSAITDLRHGSLIDEDWKGRDRFEQSSDHPQIVPLPAGVSCYAIAGTTSRQPGDLSERLLGDGLVYVDSALGFHELAERALEIPKTRTWVAYGVGHIELINHPEVYQKIQGWLGEAAVE
jgi:pimeloyl-ACP methyl ester carboxylesterase